MTDGPFRNAKLSSRWKRYGEDLVSDAASPKERIAQACHSMLDDFDIKAFSSILSSLRRYVQHPQMDLDPTAPVETIFDNNPRSFLTDSLQKHIAANLRDQLSPEVALHRALGSTVREWIGITRNRMDEECIVARDNRDMSREEYKKGIERNGVTFAGINPGDLCDALTKGNRQAFKSELRKKAGVDEGPDE
ncbi:MAG TPA: hypothetical protein DDZ81_15125 [Acetobacteraceae bacterium]|nr:hypothetical protein [Acetobacteraceae bacterium]